MKKSFPSHFPDEGLIKTCDEPTIGISSTQKALLNRRGNALYNDGDVETARRIFQATGYSDGLTRIGERYMENGKAVDALKMFKLAHSKKQSDAIIIRAALAIKKALHEEEVHE